MKRFFLVAISVSVIALIVSIQTSDINFFTKEQTNLETSVLENKKITNLKPIKKYVKLIANEKNILLYRKFKKEGEPMFLAVDPETLKTFIVSKEDFYQKEIPFEEFEKTRLHEILVSSKPIKSIGYKKGYALTIDLVEKLESQKNKFEDILFEVLSDLAEVKQMPIPVGIAISGRWAIEDEKNFNKIIDLKRQNKIDVTWINHSFRYSKNNNKFLTASNINLEEEILPVETIILEKGEIPSIFFRFPALVYNQDLLKQVADLSLVTLDANAWLSKGQKLSNGSIVLVQANGAEHDGVLTLLKNLKKKNITLLSLYQFES